MKERARARLLSAASPPLGPEGQSPPWPDGHGREETLPGPYGQGTAAHGGDLYAASRELGIPEEGIMDFSASINPLGVPASVQAEIGRSLGRLCHYPDAQALDLTRQISRRHGISPESIICGNGSTELIYLVVRALNPLRAVIPAPTFSEYERACRMGRDPEITYHPLKRDADFDLDPDEYLRTLEGSDMAFLCNPNNPTGRVIRRRDLLRIAAGARDLGCLLVLDEAFIDFVPEETLVRDVEDNPSLIVLRSMTKFYALSGLRLGYGVFPPSLVEEMKRHKEPWTVNTLAQKAGVTALQDHEYEEETFRVVRRERAFLEEAFGRCGIEHLPSAVNYYLVRHPGAGEMIPALRRRGILVRDCSNFVGLDGSYMRIAVKSEGENRRLMEEIGALCGV